MKVAEAKAVWVSGAVNGEKRCKATCENNQGEEVAGDFNIKGSGRD